MLEKVTDLHNVAILGRAPDNAEAHCDECKDKCVAAQSRCSKGFWTTRNNIAKEKSKDEKIAHGILQNAKLVDLKKEREELLEAMQYLPKPKRRRNANGAAASTAVAPDDAAPGDTTPGAVAPGDATPGAVAPNDAAPLQSVKAISRFQGGFQLNIDVDCDDTGRVLKEKIQTATVDDANCSTFHAEHQCLKVGSARGPKIEDATLLRDVLTDGAKVIVSRQR